jgi:rare lipoprotein A (peptidoglycan hydrolase)
MKLLKYACVAGFVLSSISAKAVSFDEMILSPINMGEYYAASKSVRASLYGAGEPANSHTACGQRFNPKGLYAAHRSLPCGTRLRVSYNGRSIHVTVNDRGPAAWTGKSIDLTSGAARALGFPGEGHVEIARVN